MATNRWVVLLLSAAMIAFFAGCGGGTTNVQNQSLVVGATLSIAFQPAPVKSVSIIKTAQLTAVVHNDPSNLGVDWSLTCPGNTNCGTLSPPHTASGKAVTYTPPANLSGNNLTVNIAAFAVADQNQNVVTPMTITAFGSSLKGKYVLQTKGVDITGLAYQFAGVLVLDGNGGVTSGEQTYTNTLLSTSDAIIGGSYFLGPDGRGKLSLKTKNQSLGQQGIETFSLVFLSSSQALIAKIDDPNIQGSASESSAGTMDLQTSATAPAQGYAFVVSGTDTTNANLQPTAVGGVLNIDSPGTISGAGSVADQDLAGTVTYSAAISGTVSNPDSFGAVKFNLTTGFSSTPLQFTGYIVDATHIKLIETDVNGKNATGASTAGVAIGQGAATGTFINNTALSGLYVFEIFGEDPSGLPSSLASAGVFIADGKGYLEQGYNDEYGATVQFSDRFHGKYAVDSTGTGRVDSFLSYATHGPGPEFLFYLTGNGNPPLVLDADVNFGCLGGGMAYPPGPQISFSGKYGMYFTQSNFGVEDDATSQITVNGTAQTLVGIVDTNYVFSPAWDAPLTGSFQTSGLHHFPGILSNQFFPSDLTMAYYMIDSGHGFFVETDLVQVSFGYFAARTPVCQGCP